MHSRTINIDTRGNSTAVIRDCTHLYAMRPPMKQFTIDDQIDAVIEYLQLGATLRYAAQLVMARFYASRPPKVYPTPLYRIMLDGMNLSAREQTEAVCDWHGHQFLDAYNAAREVAA